MTTDGNDEPDRGYRSVKELGRDQLVQLKQHYLVELEEAGRLNEALYGCPGWDGDGDHPLTSGEIAAADSLVPDDVVFDAYGDTAFTEEDFL